MPDEPTTPTRTIWHSSDGGQHWAPVKVAPNSVIGTMTFDPKVPWSDGFGNLYWDRLP